MENGPIMPRQASSKASVQRLPGQWVETSKFIEGANPAV